MTRAKMEWILFIAAGVVDWATRATVAEDPERRALLEYLVRQGVSELYHECGLEGR